MKRREKYQPSQTEIALEKLYEATRDWKIKSAEPVEVDDGFYRKRIEKQNGMVIIRKRKKP